VDAAGPRARGLARTALRMDAAGLRAEVDGALADLGVVDAWETVIAPVLIGVGVRHQLTGALVEVEHLLSASIAAALGALRPAPPVTADTALLACTAEEQHSLPLLALATALGAAGIPANTLGARVPATALRAAVQRTGPAAVGLWSHAARTADVRTLRHLAESPYALQFLAALGPGWAKAQLPGTVAYPGSLRRAVTDFTEALS
jgi:hypothetical protein